MAEALRLYHSAGPDLGGGGPQHRFTIPYTQVQGLPGGSTFAEFNLISATGDPLPINGLVGSGIGLPVPILSTVTGSGSQQSINISTTSQITANVTWWIVGPGTANQEVATITATDIVDATHVLMFLTNNHAIGEVMIQIFGVSTKYLDASILSVPGTGLANLGLIQMDSNPTNIYTQYMIDGTLGSPVYHADDCIPWIAGDSSTPSCTTVPPFVPMYSSGSLSSTGNPTNAIVINAASFTTSSLIFPNVRVQHLFTAFPPPNTANIRYRYWWDNL